MVEEFTAQEIWSRIRKQCEKRLSQQTISTWLSQSRAVSVLDDSLTVELGNKFTAYYVEQNYQKTLDNVASEVLDQLMLSCTRSDVGTWQAFLQRHDGMIRQATGAAASRRLQQEHP